MYDVQDHRSPSSSSQSDARRDQKTRGGHKATRTLGVVALLILPRVLPAQGNVPGAAPAESPVRDIVLSDWNGDGLLDLLVLRTDGRVRLLTGAADGRFVDSTIETGLSTLADVRQVVSADFDDDGRAELLALRAGEALLLRGASFESSPLHLSVDASEEVSSVVDFDGNSLPDLLLRGDRLRLLRNLGGGDFREEWSGPLSARTGPAPAGFQAAFEGGERAEGPSTSTATQRASGPASWGQAAGAAASRTISSVATACAATLRDQAGGSCLQASTTPALGMLHPLSQDLFIDPAGRVGIGTVTPMRDLHVFGGGIRLEEPTTGDTLELRTNGTALDIESIGRPLYINNTTGEETYIMGGRLGVGTTSPNYDLDVAGIASAQSLRVGPEGDNFRINHNDDPSLWGPNTLEIEYGPINNQDARVVFFTNGSERLDVLVADGRLGVGTTTPNAKLDVNGSARVDVLTITGGSDLAERFESVGDCEPGTVVVLDPDSPGRIRPCAEAYDRRVAGVVSGAGGIDTGLCLGQEGVADGETKVAMTGRVWVQATTENGSIEPGDLLTTSAVAGHAMKVDDPSRAFGTVLGKAVSSLETGDGLVLVLVNLQ